MTSEWIDTQLEEDKLYFDGHTYEQLLDVAARMHGIIRKLRRKEALLEKLQGELPKGER